MRFSTSSFANDPAKRRCANTGTTGRKAANAGAGASCLAIGLTALSDRIDDLNRMDEGISQPDIDELQKLGPKFSKAETHAVPLTLGSSRQSTSARCMG
jgi:hypothetical protein